LIWRLNVLSSTDSKFDVSSGGRLFQTVAEEWLKARRPRAVIDLQPTMILYVGVDLVDEVEVIEVDRSASLECLEGYDRLKVMTS